MRVCHCASLGLFLLRALGIVMTLGQHVLLFRQWPQPLVFLSADRSCPRGMTCQSHNRNSRKIQTNKTAATMLGRVSLALGKRLSASSVASSFPLYQSARCMSVTVGEAATAHDALKYSGYSDIDFTIKEDAPVYDAVQKFAAYNIGCLVVTDVSGMKSEF